MVKRHMIPVSVVIAGFFILSAFGMIRGNFSDSSRAGDMVSPGNVSPCISIPPDISSAADIEYTEGQTGHVITWSIQGYGSSSRTYAITQNGSQVATGTWVTPGTITYNVDGLLPGVYSFIVYASDDAGGPASDEVIVIVHARVFGTASDWAIVVVSVAFTGAAVLAVFKAIKTIPMVPGKR